MPLLAGETVQTDQGGYCGGFNSVIATLPNVIPTAHVISSKGCPQKGDGLHFTAEGYRTIGKRYAECMLKLLTSTGIDDATAESHKVAKEEWFDATGRRGGVCRLVLSGVCADTDGNAEFCHELSDGGDFLPGFHGLLLAAENRGAAAKILYCQYD